MVSNRNRILAKDIAYIRISCMVFLNSLILNDIYANINFVYLILNDIYAHINFIYLVHFKAVFLC